MSKKTLANSNKFSNLGGPSNAGPGLASALMRPSFALMCLFYIRITLLKNEVDERENQHIAMKVNQTNYNDV